MINTTPSLIQEASNDYGNIVHEFPRGVLRPSSLQQITDLIRSSNDSSAPFTVAVRGRGHSVRGQAMAGGGVVVDMSSLSENRGGVVVDMSSLSENRGGGGIRVCGNSRSGFYADVGAEQLWVDVARAALAKGLAPVSWTDYLYLSVGGTLSNGGIGGQTFLHGPQISNVLQLDVITGEGEEVRCSEDVNSELFLAVLGGLGQFGIISRARIVLEKAPTRVKWVRLLYSDFSTFTRDQELLISDININAPNYVEGFLITNVDSINEWRSSSFSSPSLPCHVATLLSGHAILYCIELVKYYHQEPSIAIDEELEKLIQGLSFIPGLIFRRDASFFDFLNRVGDLDDDQRGKEKCHPWLNLFIPKSRILDFNNGVLATMIPTLKPTSDLFIFYPINRNKWDDRMSAVIPEEEIFYTLGLLHSCEPSHYHIFDEFNGRIMGFCKENGIEVKQYLPHYESNQDWIIHFASKWETIQRRKAMFDPKFILSPGQNIFN